MHCVAAVVHRLAPQSHARGRVPLPVGRLLVHARALISSRRARRRPARSSTEREDAHQATLQASASLRTTSRARVPTSSRGRRPQRAPRHEGAATARGGCRQHGDRRPRARADHARSRPQKGFPCAAGCAGYAGRESRSPELAGVPTVYARGPVTSSEESSSLTKHVLNERIEDGVSIDASLTEPACKRSSCACDMASRSWRRRGGSR
jgi:hypothetical protein